MLYEKVLTSYAASPLGKCGDLGIPCNDANSSTLQTILSVAFMIIGALAVIFIIVGGIQYVLSGGNPEQTTKAKNTILYAIVGLIVSILATVIVNFVLSRIF